MERRRWWCSTGVKLRGVTRVLSRLGYSESECEDVTTAKQSLMEMTRSSREIILNDANYSGSSGSSARVMTRIPARN